LLPFVQKLQAFIAILWVSLGTYGIEPNAFLGYLPSY
jgi:hypothetical protein